MLLELTVNASWYLSTGALALVPLAIRRRWSRLEKTVWREEESYWKSLAAGDVNSYLRLFHEEFISWPCESPRPSDKPAVRQMLENLKKSYRLLSYELNPLSIRVVGDTAVVYYFVRYVVEAHGEQIEDTRRISHTWIFQDGGWKIMGGMSSTSPVTANHQPTS
ncbi:MAG TPA: nuclear transport factor 2 family protein [Acidobacteriota bacterium]|nr:nuclear transport factor 2 family protein [Acidobacteriota bacterium]